MKLAWLIPLPILAYVPLGLVYGTRNDLLMACLLLSLATFAALMLKDFNLLGDIERSLAGLSYRVHVAEEAIEKKALVPDGVKMIVGQVNELTTQYHDLKTKYEKLTLGGIFGRQS